MKKTFRLLQAAILATALLTVACDKKEEAPRDFTQEESKDKLDDSMTAMAEEFNSIATLRSAKVAEDMMKMEMETPPFEDLIAPISYVQGTSMKEMEDAIKAGLVTLTLSDQIDWGTFTYNFNTEDFDFVKGDVGTMIISSPSAEGKTENDIEIKVIIEFKDDVDYDKIKDQVHYEEVIDYTNGYYYTEKEYYYDILIKEIFTDVKFSVKQNDYLLLAFDFMVDLDNKDIPNKTEMTLQVEEFKISTQLNGSNRKDGISHNTSLKKDDTELAAYSITFSGDITDERIQEIMEEIEEIDESEAIPSDEFLASLNYDISAEMRFGDFKISGIVDGSKIFDAYDNFGDVEEFNDENMEDVQYVADEMNKAMALTLKSSNGNLVGKVEVYVAEDYWEEWNWDNGSPETIKHTYYELLLRFKFADGTYLSPEDENAETELEDMFKDLIDAIEDLGEDLEEMKDRFDE